jgi:hypothetical protein
MMNRDLWHEHNFKALRTDPWPWIPMAGQKKKQRRQLVSMWDVLSAVLLIGVLVALAYLPDVAAVR